LTENITLESQTSGVFCEKIFVSPLTQDCKKKSLILAVILGLPFQKSCDTGFIRDRARVEEIIYDKKLWEK